MKFSKVLILSGDDVRRLISMRECIGLMTQVMVEVSQRRCELPLRTGLAIGEKGCRFGWMPGYLSAPSCFGIKLTSLYPQNPESGFSSHMGVLVLFEPEHGEPRAFINAGEITSIRTAAASAVATRLLARNNAGDLAILGTGEEASSHLAAMACVCDLHRVRIWGRTEKNTKRFAEQHCNLVDVPIEICATVESAVLGADVICTTTAAPDPILEGKCLAEGSHVNLVGSSFPQYSEIDTGGILRASVFVDYLPSAHSQAGELRRAVDEGAIAMDFIRGEIGEVISGAISGRTSVNQITIYKSLGVIAQDLAAAHFIYEKAIKLGVGVMADI